MRAKHWSLAPGGEPGAVVEGVADVETCIANILATRPGEDVLRPEFGSDHWRYIDYPEDEAPAHMVREVSLALRRWEPRAEVEAVLVSGEAPHFDVTVRWTLADAAGSREYAAAFSRVPAAAREIRETVIGGAYGDGY